MGRLSFWAPDSLERFLERVFGVNQLVIDGGLPLRGEISVHGAKNSSLPLLAATILGSGESVLHNCPALSDVDAACRILS